MGFFIVLLLLLLLLWVILGRMWVFMLMVMSYVFGLFGLGLEDGDREETGVVLVAALV